MVNNVKRTNVTTKHKEAQADKLLLKIVKVLNRTQEITKR